MPLGLRAQIVFSLTLVFVISFALLGTAALRLTAAASDVNRVRSARAYAAGFATLFEHVPLDDEAALDVLLDSLRARARLRAVRFVSASGRVHLRGLPPREAGVEAALARGGSLTLWPEPPSSRTRLPLANLLLFYVTMTGLAVLVLAYIALTYLIVRPLDRLTRGSELLAAGAREVRVPELGAAEVVRLAAAFNDMARQLHKQRDALEQRLRELEQRTDELKTAQRQLIHGERLASVGRLAAGVAHEIGNPLAAILGLVELLHGGELSSEQAREFLVRIQRETERIHRIIRDLLDFSRREPDSELASGSADLGRVIEDAVNLVRPQKESKDVAIEVVVEAGLTRVRGAEARLTQVVLNLLLNAVDALEGRGTVQIEAKQNAAGCTLVVRDDGPGLAESVLEHLFEPFTTTKPPGKGTGLGLAVCLALVEGMGGSITAENQPEGGARFTVQLAAAN